MIFLGGFCCWWFYLFSVTLEFIVFADLFGKFGACNFVPSSGAWQWCLVIVFKNGVVFGDFSGVRVKWLFLDVL